MYERKDDISMKKAVALLLCLCVLIVFPSCGKDEDEIEDTKRTAKTSENPIVTEPTTIATPMSQWGFNNIEEWGSGFLEITGYNLSGSDEFVFYCGDYSMRTWTFENGYIVTHKVEDNEIMTYDAQQYYVVNNDTATIPGDGTLTIDERKTVDDKEFMVFVEKRSANRERWYVPYSLIDWDRGFEPYQADDGYDYRYAYKFYLK